MVKRTLYDEEHELFRDTVRAFVDKEIAPHHEQWEAAGIVDKALFRRAGDLGLLGLAVPEELGGGGTDDFRFNAVVSEELCRAGMWGSGAGIVVHNDVCIPYVLSGDDEQRGRWLPGLCSGELVAAVAMTEPGAGSDLAGIQTRAKRSGDHYVLNGAKTFISNGINADVVIVAAKTDPDQGHRGISLLVVEAGMAGFERGRNLAKVGLKAQDTAELFFSDVIVPVENRLGPEGGGFAQLVRNLAQERLTISVGAVAHARAAFEWTIDYARQRHAFGQPIGSFQHNRFVLAEMATELDVAQCFVDQQVLAHTSGELSAEDAAKGKWWTTELQQRVVDRCLQLHGGYGYMLEYPIGRAFCDARIQTIYGGTTEIMKEIVGRSLGV